MAKKTPRSETDTAGDVGLDLETVPERKLKRPPLFRVLMHNDNFTTRDFVVEVLVTIFHKSEGDAVQIMLSVHTTGIGTVGAYPYEVAESKVRKTEALAREHEFPLRLSMEPDSDDET